MAVGRTFEGLVAEHAGLMGTLPPPPRRAAAAGGATGAAVAEPALLAESELIAAEPRLWAALSSELRKARSTSARRGGARRAHSVRGRGGK